MVGSPETDVDGVEDAEEWEPPGDAVNDDTLASGEELVDNGPKKQDMDDGPTRYERTINCNKTVKSYQMRNAHGAGVIYVSLAL